MFLSNDLLSVSLFTLLFFFSASSLYCSSPVEHGKKIIALRPVVRKSVSANPGLKVKRGFDFSCIKACIRANVLWGFTLVKGKTEENKI